MLFWSASRKWARLPLVCPRWCFLVLALPGWLDSSTGSFLLLIISSDRLWWLLESGVKHLPPQIRTSHGGGDVCFSLFLLLSQNTKDQRPYKQQKSGGGPLRSGSQRGWVWGWPFPRLQACVFLYPYLMGRELASSLASLEGTNPVHEALLPRPRSPPKVPTSQDHHLGGLDFGIWILEAGDTNIQSVSGGDGVFRNSINRVTWASKFVSGWGESW